MVRLLYEKIQTQPQCSLWLHNVHKVHIHLWFENNRSQLHGSLLCYGPVINIKQHICLHFIK